MEIVCESRYITCSAFLAVLLPLKFAQNLRVIEGPSVSMKKASTRARMIVARPLPTAVIELVRVEPTLSSLTKLCEKSPNVLIACSRKLSMWRASPISSIKVRLLVAPSTMLGRILANLAVSLMIVGTTMATNVQIKPTTRI